MRVSVSCVSAVCQEGQLVPVEITVKLIKQAMEKHGWAQVPMQH